NEGTVPSIESVRAVARAFRRPVWEGLVAAGILTEDELAGRPASDTPDLRLIDDETLLNEVRRRMGRGRPPRGRQPSSAFSEIGEQSGMDMSETDESEIETNSVRRRGRARRSGRAAS